MKRFDAVIVGGGIVGASLALALGQVGSKVLLIEQHDVAPENADIKNTKTIALSYASAKIYEALGVWNSLCTHVTPINQVRVNVQGQFGSCLLDHKKQKTDALGYVISTSVLERALNNALTQYETVESVRPATLGDTRHLQDRWEVQFNAGSQTHLVSSNLLIGSDGANSPLRHSQYIDCKESAYGHYGIMVNVKIKRNSPFEALERFLKKGAIAVLPWQNDWATCVWTAEEKEAFQLMTLNDDDFKIKCQEQLGRSFGKIIDMGKRFSFPLKMKLAKMQTSSRFVLMGNAAHNLHPIAAQGLNLSLRDIWQFILPLRGMGQSPIDLGSPEYLEQYVASRREDQARVVFATDQIARWMASRLLPEEIRAMGVTLFDCIFPFKHWFTRYGMGLG